MSYRYVSPIPWFTNAYAGRRLRQVKAAVTRRQQPHRPGRRDWGWHHLITAVSSTRLLIGEAARIVNFAIVEEISAVLSQMRTEAAR